MYVPRQSDLRVSRNSEAASSRFREFVLILVMRNGRTCVYHKSACALQRAESQDPQDASWLRSQRLLVSIGRQSGLLVSLAVISSIEGLSSRNVQETGSRFIYSMSSDTDDRSTDERRAATRRFSVPPARLEDRQDDFDLDEDDADEAHAQAPVNMPTKAQINALMLKSILINAALICSWFSLSMALSLYNKWMFSSHDNKKGRKNLNFPFPLFTTAGHMLVQFLGSFLVLTLIPRLKPPKDHNLTVKDYTTRIGPCGMATGLDIGFSNASLKTITLAFYTMCKSSSLAFVLLFAFLFRLEKLRLSLVGVIAIITVGVVLMVATETHFVLEGFILVVTAAAMGGLRWALTQILLKENPSTSNPFSSIFHLAPIMFASLIVVAMVLEGPIAFLRAPLWSQKGLLAIPILLFPGVLAFLMTASEFGLIQRTSVVTLSVAGIFKEVLTIGLSALVYGDELTPMNISGLLITIVGIGVYNYLRFKRMRLETKEAIASVLEQRQDQEPLVSRITTQQ